MSRAKMAPIRILMVLGISLLFLTTAPNSGRSEDPIIIAFNSDWPPYSSGAGTAVDGILPRFVRSIVETNLDIPVKFVGYPWKRVQKGVERGDFDAMVTVPTTARLHYAHSSRETAFVLRMSPVKRKGTQLPDLLPKDVTARALAKLKVCDILGNGWAERFYEKLRIPFQKATNVESCLRLIAGGRADILIQPHDVARVKIAEAGLGEQIEIDPLALESMAFTMLVSKQSPWGQSFLNRFDAEIRRIRENGDFDRLLDKARTIPE